MQKNFTLILCSLLHSPLIENSEFKTMIVTGFWWFSIVSMVVTARVIAAYLIFI
jgi:hypothetical protein